ncbi:MAG TPA: CbiX/SirB N-terminal domain-containing protein [Polyangiaceae bacterium]|nr:CbiX/SirB N-terminal domain-containing protein [Polyangiaceae bacterium]
MQTALAGLVAVALLIGCAAHQTSPQGPSRPEGDFGVLIMAHGGPAEWNAAVLDSVKPLRERYDVEVAFGMADATTIQEAVRKLEARGARRIGVVRLFVSGASWYERTQQILGIAPGAPNTKPALHGEHAGHGMAFFRIDTRASFALSKDGLADADTMGIVLAERAATLSHDPAKEDVLVLAHGPETDDENAQWLTKLDVLTRAIRARTAFRRVQVETLREDWPDKRAEAEARIRSYVARATTEGGKAIVIPFRVHGFGPYADVLKGLDYVSDGNGLIPHPEVTRWILRQVTLLEAGPFSDPLRH